MIVRNCLIVYAIPRNREEKSTLETVKNILRKHKIAYSLANRDFLNREKFSGMDLIIPVGGDGTFLRASQFADKETLFGVNADVKNKEGFFMKSDKGNFEEKLKKIVRGDFMKIALPRLKAYINGSGIDSYALNEFFIGPRKSYHAAKYWIYVDEEIDKKERQKSSGVLVATPTGSHAWAKSCLNETLPLNSKKFLFVVREPYEGNVFKGYKLKEGLLEKSQKISIISEMLDGILIADSVGMEYKLKCGSKVSVGLSDKSINAVWE